MTTKIFIVFIFCIGVTTRAFAEGGSYSDHGKRDPFLPLVSSSGTVVYYDDDLLISDLVLEGIIFEDQGQNVAIINGIIVKVNDKIGLFTIEQVTASEVILYKDEERYVLKLKEE